MVTCWRGVKVVKMELPGMAHKPGEKAPPPAYDYSEPSSWAAFPGGGMEGAPAELL